VLRRTPLHDFHAANGKLVEFAGYEMPIWYSSITEEHLAVRNHAGIFDISHMGRLVVGGPDATRFVEALVPTNTALQPPGKSYYTLLLNSAGGIIDDIIVIKRPDDYLLVVNAASRAKDIEHIRNLSIPYSVSLEDITDGTTMIAVQGPEAARALQPISSTNLSEIKRFTHAQSTVGKGQAIITRTGYTGEDGFEVIIHDSGLDDSHIAASIWADLTTRARPCGLGARDSLRVEAGLPLYGSDIDETTNPVEAELSWVLSKGKTGYVGADAIAHFRVTQPRRLRRGVLMEDKIPRRGFAITDLSGRQIGETTSGTFSPLLRKGLAMGYIATPDSQIGGAVEVSVRGSPGRGTIVKTPFYDDTKYGWKRTS
jgi:glycine cleavage system T protein (aminomethyltransferase)